MRHRRGTVDKKDLERIYARYNRREFVHPDPLEFLYRYDDMRDREVAGLVASSLAYGRVAQILRSVAKVLDRMTPSPARFLGHATNSRLTRTFTGFRHRFTRGEDLARMLAGARFLMERYGSLENAFAAHLDERHATVLPALTAFVRELTRNAGGELPHLLPRPERGSACKRLHLFLRWMVRRDRVDPGGWERVGPSKLVVPLDTHMFKVCRALGFTTRRRASGAAALEATAGFRAISPEDPVRYDFALTRPGIRRGVDGDAFLGKDRVTEVA